MSLLVMLGPDSLSRKLIADSPKPELVITVRLYNYSDVSGNTMKQATEIAAGIFEKIAIELRWLYCFPAGEKERMDPSCHQLPTATVINLRVAERTANPEIFECGLAIPAGEGGFSKHAIVFHECVDALSGVEGSTQVAVLGHIIAHELGHLLLGLGSHSLRGIMKYPWGRREIEFADKGWLRFTPQQGERMREAVRARNRAEGAVSKD